MQSRVVCVLGTRPEAVKMAPVVLRLRRQGSGFEVRVVTTGQHRELLDRALADFDLAADRDLGVMQPNQSLAELTARALVALDDAIVRERPDMVMAQGDTTSALCAGLASFYHRIPFAHVEAGLRTGQPYAPFPEEMNRTLAGHLAELHFAPTAQARENLLREGISSAAIHVTGNTVIDALLMTAQSDLPLPVRPPTERYLLVTAHRREHFGAPLEHICAGLLGVVERHADLSVVFPVHPNPNVLELVTERLSGHPRIRLIEPVGYPAFVALMKGCFAILTDSGGVQEEAPSLAKPVIVLRDATERPEAVAAGCARLVGPNCKEIVRAVDDLIDHPEEYARSAEAANPFGDGWASERIARVVATRLGLDPGPWPADMPRQWPPMASSLGR
jgi:UDP-N-acetylglucosamine 2-epimerase (non-hydrolysing)